MSEFGKEDFERWLNLALNHDCSISSAIYYDIYFTAIRDPGKLKRALVHFVNELKDYGIEIKVQI